MPFRGSKRPFFLPVAAAATVFAAHGASAAIQNASSLPAFARDKDALPQLFPGATIDALSGGCVVVAPAPFTSPVPATDSLYGWRFSRAVWVFAPRVEGPVKGLFRVVTVHHEPADLDQARRTASLVGRLWSLYSAHFERDVRFPLEADSADLYLASEAPAGNANLGGETRNDAIYVFGTGVTPRTSLEWVRTVAHEWGHLTLPAARGYRDPENDAAGYLGERLFLKWMCAESVSTAAPSPDGATQRDLELYNRRQVTPLITRFQEGGAGSPLLDGADTAAMDYYTGSVLAADDAFGSGVTGRALFSVLADRGRDFSAALRRLLATRNAFDVNLPAWVPLPKGRYRMSAPAGRPEAFLHVSTSAWKWIPATMPRVRISRSEVPSQ
jgi:hypothetical protein